MPFVLRLFDLKRCWVAQTLKLSDKMDFGIKLTVVEEGFEEHANDALNPQERLQQPRAIPDARRHTRGGTVRFHVWQFPTRTTLSPVFVRGDPPVTCSLFSDSLTRSHPQPCHPSNRRLPRDTNTSLPRRLGNPYTRQSHKRKSMNTTSLSQK